MNPHITRLLNQAQSYLGVQGGSARHQALIDAYNAVRPLPVGYPVRYSDDWCDVFVTVVADQTDLATVIGRECGVPRHLQWCQDQGIWLGDAWPQPGDLIFFDFGGGPAAHIGYVESVDAASQDLSTLEGNWLNQVVRRTYPIGDWRILGYARPRYPAGDDVAVAAGERGPGCADEGEDEGGATPALAALAQAVIRGDWGNGAERVERLTAAGYDAEAVQELVNEWLAEEG